MASWEVEGDLNDRFKSILLPKVECLLHRFKITEASLYHLFKLPILEAVAPEPHLEIRSLDDLCQLIQTIEEKLNHFHSVIEENTAECSPDITQSMQNNREAPLPLRAIEFHSHDNNVRPPARRATDSDPSLTIARSKIHGQYYCRVCWTRGHVPQQSSENSSAQARLTTNEIYAIIMVIPKEATVHVGRLLHLTDDQVEKCIKDAKDNELEKLYKIIRMRENNENPTKQQIVCEIEEALITLDHEASLNKLRRICCNKCKHLTS
ncbi:hypothetical protein XENTR_v10000383 [Xenopus tropicalis]|uniref:Uncharacterized protein LOC101731252 n=1 Tax=Xenopus tropicalis TaxID=8364 RepID=A0A8J1J023_XENTR|nr:uncharacterized protein LOC101731252 [Xenopus tropicalis]KAE8629165.1 hypothetical protein XENTR_v10000383 [Xenopus tropicalis]KAE8629166.1 hypothetical protein XENTR_v10000383 [Xenopus tropicalis]KAE8629167.1 hypothetical protein XENTR_v10000383 [Xenopus tropicalis]KAE8629168.1 hypothetical protein XENTR_v10000383 [Xenopus tropicalis]|eukprot:XP_017950699.1 PREDICTED: uncharacterized protein LOC101731252 [Xenopus tropicalis]